MPMMDVFGYKLIAEDQTGPAVDSAIQGTEKLEKATTKTARQTATEFRNAGHGIMVVGLSLTSTMGIMDQMGIQTGIFGSAISAAGQAMTAMGGAISIASVMITAFGVSINTAMPYIGAAVLVIGALIAAYKILNDKKKETVDVDAIFTWGTRELNYELMQAQHALDGTRRMYDDLAEAINAASDATREIKSLTEEVEDLGWEGRELGMDRVETEQKIVTLAMQKRNLEVELQSGTYMTLTQIDDAKKRYQDISFELERYQIHLEKIKDRQGEITDRTKAISEPGGELPTAVEDKSKAEAALRKMGFPTVEEAKARLAALKAGPLKEQEAAVTDIENRIYNLKLSNEDSYFKTVIKDENERHRITMENIEAETFARLGGMGAPTGMGEASAGETQNVPDAASSALMNLQTGGI